MEKIKLRDLYLASYLKSEGIPFEGVEHRRGYCIFIFSPSNKIDELMQRYFRGKVTINIQTFRACLRDLKSLAAGDISLAHDGDKK